MPHVNESTTAEPQDPEGGRVEPTPAEDDPSRSATSPEEETTVDKDADVSEPEKDDVSFDVGKVPEGLEDQYGELQKSFKKAYLKKIEEERAISQPYKDQVESFERMLTEVKVDPSKFPAYAKILGIPLDQVTAGTPKEEKPAEALPEFKDLADMMDYMVDKAVAKTQTNTTQQLTKRDTAQRQNARWTDAWNAIVTDDAGASQYAEDVGYALKGNPIYGTMYNGANEAQILQKILLDKRTKVQGMIDSEKAKVVETAKKKKAGVTEKGSKPITLSTGNALRDEIIKEVRLEEG